MQRSSINFPVCLVNGKRDRDNLFLPLNFPSGKSFLKSNSWQIIIREGKPPRRFEYYANGQTDRIKFMKQVEATNTERASKKIMFLHFSP